MKTIDFAKEWAEVKPTELEVLEIEKALENSAKHPTVSETHPVRKLWDSFTRLRKDMRGPLPPKV